MQPAQPSIFEMLLPFAFIFVIFYFLIIRPQSKRMKQQESFLAALKPGEYVFTTSGIMGRIESVTDLFVMLQVADGVNLKILRKNIAGTQTSLQESKGKKENK